MPYHWGEYGRVLCLHKAGLCMCVWQSCMCFMVPGYQLVNVQASCWPASSWRVLLAVPTSLQRLPPMLCNTHSRTSSNHIQALPRPYNPYTVTGMCAQCTVLTELLYKGRMKLTTEHWCRTAFMTRNNRLQSTWSKVDLQL